MKNRNRRAKFHATPVEYLGLAPGEIPVLRAVGEAQTEPIVTISLRPSPASNFTALNFIVDRATLERMREDIDFVLQHSPLMQNAPGREAGTSLNDLEGRDIFDPDLPGDGK